MVTRLMVVVAQHTLVLIAAGFLHLIKARVSEWLLWLSSAAILMILVELVTQVQISHLSHISAFTMFP